MTQRITGEPLPCQAVAVGALAQQGGGELHRALGGVAEVDLELAVDSGVRTVPCHGDDPVHLQRSAFGRRFAPQFDLQASLRLLNSRGGHSRENLAVLGR